MGNACNDKNLLLFLIDVKKSDNQLGWPYMIHTPHVNGLCLLSDPITTVCVNRGEPHTSDKSDCHVHKSLCLKTGLKTS